MLAAERQRWIMDLLARESSVRVVELAKHLQVSGETIRRDLEVLESQGLLRRVYGGAVTDAKETARLYQDREVHRTAEKQAIGRLAATLVQDGDTLFIDVGTTALAFANCLAGKERLTVVTPSLLAANRLKQSTDARVILTGGDLQSDEPYLTGYLAEEALSQFHADRAFIATGGISFDRGLTDYNDFEVRVRKRMMASASQVVVLADTSKIGVRAFSVIGELTAMDVLVTDDAIHDSVRNRLVEMGIEVMIAPTRSATRLS
ncbi:DeoR/GlpR family DNA-binding transcription regulator [Alicyclobacillus acidiphilus]|uniref:DeoR/GlpR family DNA-binding transcription regulator n=1 Tax=Alicyclobacillus acidiphilus TaxID=182455 RepID=UPI0014702249|nr:DeoR/GlpR family DNA-binding transcription regulator [Alicyclobacillus acidiphilus]